jgi:hypothetical protein
VEGSELELELEDELLLESGCWFAPNDGPYLDFMLLLLCGLVSSAVHVARSDADLAPRSFRMRARFASPFFNFSATQPCGHARL